MGAPITDQDRVILGDLTTVFTPPAECTVAVGMCEGCNVAWWGQTCADQTVRDGTNCWPTTTEGAPEPSQGPFLGWGFYSPGLMCPDGYTSACEAIEGSTSNYQHQFLMEPSETFVGCCPSGFKCANTNGQTCIWGVKSTSIATMSCDVAGNTINHDYTTLPNSAVSPPVNQLFLFAPMIQIAWQSSDRDDASITTTSISTGTSAATTTKPTTTTTTTTPGADANSSTTTTSTNPGLSTAAVAGIAVGAAVLFLLTLAAAIFIWRRKRNSNHLPPSVGGSKGSASDTISNPPTYAAVPGGPPSPDIIKGYGPYYGVVEIGQGHERVEAPGEGMGQPVEVPGGHGRVEMYAGSPAPPGYQVPPPGPPAGFQGQGGGYNYVGEGGAYQEQGGYGHGPVEMSAHRYG